MKNAQIDPAKVTRPIQLLAAWLVGLLLLDGTFLTAAATIKNPSWASAALVVASICNVPIFLSCLFLLMTRFRRQMQEDPYYSKYVLQLLALSKATGQTASPKDAKEVQKIASGAASELKKLLAKESHDA